MYKIPYPSLLGKFIKSVGIEYQVLKRGREYHGCGEEYNILIREMGCNIIFPIILRLLGRISSAEVEKGTEIYRKKIKI